MMLIATRIAVVIAIAYSNTSESPTNTPYKIYRYASSELEASLPTSLNLERTLNPQRSALNCRLMENSFSQLSFALYKEGFATSEGISPYLSRSPTFAALTQSLYNFERQRHSYLVRLACPARPNAPAPRGTSCIPLAQVKPCSASPESQPLQRQWLSQTTARMQKIRKYILYENRQYARLRGIHA